MTFAIQAARLTHARVPLVEPFRISSGAVSEKDGLIVQLESDGLTGVGESSPMAGPFYSADTPEICWAELRDVLIPALLQQQFPSHPAALEWINAQPASNFSKTGVETALWDLEARRQGKPLYELLGGTNRPVESGLAVGLYDTPAEMLRVIEKHLACGYKRVKIKIERGRDVELVRAVRGAFGEIPLFVDANGAYDLTDLHVFQTLDEFNLMMFEQPFTGSMLAESAELQRRVRTPVCLDESLETAGDVQRAIELGSFKIGNIKIQRVGGFSNALAIHDLCREHKIPVWTGTMPELGVGCAQGIALATLSHCTFPTDVEASLRWFRDDIVAPLIEVRDGHLYPSASPGLGFEVDEAKLDRYKVASIYF
ncbi:MAG: o-succinylbenzoate synthase [Bryobacterales bacterium]|nr:o-succinylbenzoate synthase [Bryobacterales bacterium]